MNINKFIRKLFKIQYLKVCSAWFTDHERQLHLKVKPYKNGCRCPKCGRRCRIVHQLEEDRHWRDIRICGKDVYLHYRPKEIDCPTHGRLQEEIPWAGEYCRITYRLEYLVVRYADDDAEGCGGAFGDAGINVF